MKTLVTWPLALTLVAACTSDSGENITTQHSPLTAIGPNIQVSNTGPANAATETAGTAFPSSAISGTNVVVSFNYWRPPPPTGGHTTVAWARSVDLGVSFQPSHFADDPGYVIPPITMNNGAVFGRYLGDTSVAGVGLAGATSFVDSVGLASIVFGTIAGNEVLDAALALSIDGGDHFNNSVRLSEVATGGGTLSGGDGVQVASNGRGKLYTWWWGANKSWLRPVTVGAIPPYLTLGSVIDLSSQLMVAGPIHASIAVVPNGPTLDSIYILYTDLFLPNSWDCTNPINQVTRQVTWWMSVSPDSGATWSSYQVFVDNAWPQCLTNQTNGSNRTRGSINVDPTSGRAMIAVSRSKVDAAGHNVGTRVHTCQWPSFGGPPTFDCWIPICNPAVCPRGQPCDIGGTGSNPIPPVGETFCNQYGPEMRISPLAGGSWVAKAWHDTRDSISPPPPPPGPPPGPPGSPINPLLNLQADIWGSALQPGPPVIYYHGSRVTPLAANVPWTQTQPWPAANTAWGDYEGMAEENGHFHAFWGDNRAGGNAQIFTARFDP